MMLDSSLIVLGLALSSVPALQPVLSSSKPTSETFNKMTQTNPTTSTSPTTSSSTSAPTISTSQPTSTAKPITVPKPTEWVVRDDNNDICIMARMVIGMDVNYTTKSNEKANSTFHIWGVEDAVASGVCSDHKQTLFLTTNTYLVVEFEFLQNVINGTAPSTYSLSKINLKVPTNLLPYIKANESPVVLTHPIEVFSLALNKSYYCEQEISFSLNESSNNKTVGGNMILSHLQVEAFSKKQEASYSEAVYCSHPISSSYLVAAVIFAIVVFVALLPILLASIKCPSRTRARSYRSN